MTGSRADPASTPTFNRNGAFRSINGASFATIRNSTAEAVIGSARLVQFANHYLANAAKTVSFCFIPRWQCLLVLTGSSARRIVLRSSTTLMLQCGDGFQGEAHMTKLLVSAVAVVILLSSSALAA